MPAPPLHGLPSRLLLRPGTVVVRRDERTLQVGLDPPHRAALTDHPDVRRMLHALRHDGLVPHPPPPPAAYEALLRLVDASLVLDADLPTGAAGALAAPALAALRAVHGEEAGSRVLARQAARVGVVGPPELREPARRLLHAGGVRADRVELADPGSVDAWLLLADMEVPREQLDPLVREGVAHLVLAGRGGRPRLGPLVVPGVTACLRCVDAEESEQDPRRPLVLEQAGVWRDPVPPRDPVLTALLLAWAAADLLRLVDGDRPTTWSTTASLTDAGEPVLRPRARHPHCGCAWDVVPLVD